jgi:trypsin
MRQVIIVVLLLSINSASYAYPNVSRTRSPFIRPFIVGGTEVEDFSEFAFQLSLRRMNSHICGASVIAKYWALSAAHCFEGNVHPDELSFRAGSIDRTEGGIIVKVRQYFIHPQFDIRTYNFDAAVLRTVEPLEGKDIKPILLIKMSEFINPGTLATVSGWGFDDRGILPERLQKLEVPVWEQRRCFEKWFRDVTSNMFCAGGDVGFDSCKGDSGGPLVFNGIQIGVVSTGAPKCGTDFPGVYTNITHPSIRMFIFDRTNV